MCVKSAMIEIKLLSAISSVFILQLSFSDGKSGIEKFIPDVNEELKPFVVPTLIKNNINSFAGYLNGTDDNKMFFWYFPSESSSSNPLIVWLQGDLGTSSVEAIFENNGPFYVKPSRGLNMRKYYWSQMYNVLYLDTTVGAGFSYGVKYNNHKNIDDIINNLEVTLNSFLILFGESRDRDLYLAGDGFACLIITKLAKKLDESKRSKLKGIILENGFCEPFSAINVAGFFNTLRIIDAIKLDALLREEKYIASAMKNGKFEEAFDKYDTYIKALLTPYKTKFNNYTGYESSRNLLYNKPHLDRGSYRDYMEKDMVKKYLHIENKNQDIKYADDKSVLRIFRGELMKSSTEGLGYLLGKYRILLYYGQMNPELSPKGAYLAATSIKWCGADYVEDINYNPWFVDKILAGYVVDTRVGGCPGSLSWALVRNAGKNIADEKQMEVKDLINKFISQSFSTG